MYAFKTLIVFFVIFASLANALPMAAHQRLRRSCPHKPSSGKPTPTPAENADVAKPASTSHKSSATPKSKTNSTSSTPSTGISLSALFPVAVKTGSEGWTTAPGAQDALPLSDATFRPTKLLSALSHSYVAAPDGKKAMKAHYPKGSYTLGQQPAGGLSFYSPGPSDVDLTTAKEATLGYSVMFDKNWQWNKGGKLPGLYGGDSAEDAVSCSGGRRSTKCFSARFMWRADGKGELYTYLPPGLAGNTNVCKVQPQSDCNPTYGASVGRGAFNFKIGEWNQISERVRLNDAGKANGELEVFFNGKSVINVSGLTLRDSSEGRIQGIQMQTFFGGHDSSYATPVDTNSYFSDFSVAITETL